MANLKLQHALVMWQSRKCKRVMLPLGPSVFINLLATITFLVARYAFPSGKMVQVSLSVSCATSGITSECLLIAAG
jgi:hypothetical protein